MQRILHKHYRLGVASFLGPSWFFIIVGSNYFSHAVPYRLTDPSSIIEDQRDGRWGHFCKFGYFSNVHPVHLLSIKSAKQSIIKRPTSAPGSIIPREASPRMAARPCLASMSAEVQTSLSARRRNSTATSLMPCISKGFSSRKARLPVKPS